MSRLNPGCGRVARSTRLGAGLLGTGVLGTGFRGPLRAQALPGRSLLELTYGLPSRYLVPSFRARDQAAPPSLVLALPGSGPLARRKVIQVALPAALAITPLLVGAFKDWSGRARIWFWGDQALIDLEAHNSLVGRDLLGVYDRYGWHHLGPVWLQLLGVARWLGGGSPVAVSLGFYALQAVAVVAIVVVAHRLRPGLTGWWAAVVLLGYEWSFGLERLGTVWAPYAIALPAALLVLLVADVAVSRDPWPSTIAAAICASFLCQTDISTVVLVLVLVVATPFLRVTSRAGLRVDARGPSDTSSGDRAWGWATELAQPRRHFGRRPWSGLAAHNGPASLDQPGEPRAGLPLFDHAPLRPHGQSFGEGS